MSVAHDVGGVQGFGPVVVDPNEPVFHTDWERRAFGLGLAVLYKGAMNVEEFRFGYESMHPASYHRSPYFERWIVTIEQNLIEKGFLTSEELEERTREIAEVADWPSPPAGDPTLAQSLERLVRDGFDQRREVPDEPRFATDDAVRVHTIVSTGHSRLPRYLRAKQGVVMQDWGAFIFPDTNARREGENPEHVYCVRFDSHELWGDAAEDNESLFVDLWESYLEPA